MFTILSDDLIGQHLLGWGKLTRKLVSATGQMTNSSLTMKRPSPRPRVSHYFLYLYCVYYLVSSLMLKDNNQWWGRHSRWYGIVLLSTGKFETKLGMSRIQNTVSPFICTQLSLSSGWIPAGNLYHTAESASLPSMSGMKANVRNMSKNI